MTQTNHFELCLEFHPNRPTDSKLEVQTFILKDRLYFDNRTVEVALFVNFAVYAELIFIPQWGRLRS